MFQLPLGPWPFPEGTKLRCLTRPWWGVGTVEGVNGYFTIVWITDGNKYRWRYNATGWDHLKAERVVDA